MWKYDAVFVGKAFAQGKYSSRRTGLFVLPPWLRTRKLTGARFVHLLFAIYFIFIFTPGDEFAIQWFNSGAQIFKDKTSFWADSVNKHGFIFKKIGFQCFKNMFISLIILSLFNLVSRILGDIICNCQYSEWIFVPSLCSSVDMEWHEIFSGKIILSHNKFWINNIFNKVISIDYHKIFYFFSVIISPNYLQHG